MFPVNFWQAEVPPKDKSSCDAMPESRAGSLPPQHWGQRDTTPKQADGSSSLELLLYSTEMVNRSRLEARMKRRLACLCNPKDLFAEQTLKGTRQKSLDLRVH